MTSGDDMFGFIKPWDEWSKVDKVVLWIACGAVAAIAATLGQHIEWNWIVVRAG